MSPVQCVTEVPVRSPVLGELGFLLQHVANRGQDDGRDGGGAGVNVPGGLGGVAVEGRDGWRDGESYGEPVCGGSSEGEQRGVLRRRSSGGGLQPVYVSAGGDGGVLVGGAASGDL